MSRVIFRPRQLLWLLPIVLAVLGWHWIGWLGVPPGLVLGYVAANVVWVTQRVSTFRTRLTERRRRAAELSSEELRAIASDPTAPEMAFAIGELDKRGIHVRPSLESLLALLTSPEAGRRILGMTLMFGIYPEVFAKIGQGSSSADPPDVWRARIAALGDSN